MRARRRWVSAIVFAVAAAWAAQTVRSAPEPATEDQTRVASERPPGPTIDFGAVLEDGTPVAELHAGDVEVRIDGRLRTILAIHRVSAGPIPAGAEPTGRVPRPFGTNADVALGRHVALVVDEESFVAGQEPLLRNAVEGLLRVLGPADRVAFAALPFGGVRVPSTSDTTLIRTAMATFAAQGNRRESGSDMACRTRRFLEALDGFLLGHTGRPAPLTVVAFTAGLAAPRRDAPMTLAPGMCELLVNHFERLTATAGAARANVYVLQPTDIGMSGAAWRETIAGRDFLGSDNPLEGIEHFAGATGGTRMALDGTGTESLLRVVRESAAYFSAELRPEPREVVGRSRQLAVRVRRAGVTVRARPEVTFPDRSPRPASQRITAGDVLMAPSASSGPQIRVAGFTVQEPGGRLRVGVVIEPADPAAALTSAGAALLHRGEIVARWFAPDPAARPLLGAMPAVAGRYRVRAAAIDDQGRFGVAEDDVDVGLVQVGPLALGSLQLGVSLGDGRVRPTLLFGREPTALASFDIYGGAAGTGLSAVLDVARDIGGPALTTMPLAFARVDDHRVVATAAVPVGALAPGDYVVRANIRLTDGTTGRVLRTLRKTAGVGALGALEGG